MPVQAEKTLPSGNKVQFTFTFDQGEALVMLAYTRPPTEADRSVAEGICNDILGTMKFRQAGRTGLMSRSHARPRNATLN